MTEWEIEKRNSWHKVDCTYCTLSDGRKPRVAASCQVQRTTERQTDTDKSERQRASGKQREAATATSETLHIHDSLRIPKSLSTHLFLFLSLLVPNILSFLRRAEGRGWRKKRRGRVEAEVLGTRWSVIIAKRDARYSDMKKPWKSNSGGRGKKN